MKTEVSISEEQFYDILFDNQNSVVEKQSVTSQIHVTSLVVNGVLKAWREITAEGIVFMGYK